MSLGVDGFFWQIKKLGRRAGKARALSFSKECSSLGLHMTLPDTGERSQNPSLPSDGQVLCDRDGPDFCCFPGAFSGLLLFIEDSHQYALRALTFQNAHVSMYIKGKLD